MFHLITFLFLGPVTPQLDILEDLPSPTQFEWEANDGGRDEWFNTRAELKKLNTCLEKFSKLSRSEQRKAMLDLIAEARKRLTDLIEKKTLLHVAQYAEVDPNKLDFIALAKGDPPALDRRRMDDAWRKGVTWPSIDVRTRADGGGYMPIDSRYVDPNETMLQLGPQDWDKAEKLVEVGYYDLPRSPEEMPGLRDLYAMPSPTGFRWFADDDFEVHDQLELLNRSLDRFSRLPAKSQRRAMLELVHESLVLQSVRGHDQASVMFDFGKLDFIRVARGKPPLLDFSGMSSQWKKGAAWPEVAVNGRYFPLPRREWPGNIHELPVDDCILVIQRERAKAEKLINDGAYDLPATPPRQK
jgi:hypothetical protein